MFKRIIIKHKLLIILFAPLVLVVILYFVLSNFSRWDYRYNHLRMSNYFRKILHKPVISGSVKTEGSWVEPGKFVP